MDTLYLGMRCPTVFATETVQHSDNENVPEN